MSLGTNCAFLKINAKRITGPVDNVECSKVAYIEHLIKKTYLKEIATANLKPDYFEYDHFDRHLKKQHKKVLNHKDLGLYFAHVSYDSNFIKNQVIRLQNFYNFYDKVSQEENYYFLLSLFSYSQYKLINYLDIKDILIKYNLMEKTIVFGPDDYKSYFQNYIVVPYDNANDDTFKNNTAFILQFFEDNQSSYIKDLFKN